MLGNKRIKGLLSTALVCGAMAMTSGANAGAPVVRIIDGAEITPTTAYTSNTTHTEMWDVGVHPEITALARSLRYNPALIYQYVRDNIETLPIYGLKKGALGALLDKKGTSFDQAALFLELMKASDEATKSGGADSDLPDTNFSPVYRFIRADVTSDEISDWYGLDDRQDVCNLLKAGSIPYNIVVGGSSNTDCGSIGAGDYTEARILQVVVEATVDGSLVAFDPSFKKQNYISGRSSLGTDMGFNLTDLQGAAAFGTDTTVDGFKYIFDDNQNSSFTSSQAAVENKLETLSSNLVATLKTGENYKLSTVDLVGGVEIAEANEQGVIPSSWPALASLPHFGASLDAAGVSDMPDQYRTWVKLTHAGETFSFYLDEVYGRRLWFQKYYEQMRLIVGERILWETDYDSSDAIHVWMNGPSIEGQTETFNSPFAHGNVAAFTISSGDTGLGVLGRFGDDKWQELNVDSSFTKTSYTYNDEEAFRAQVGLATSFLTQQSRLRRLVEGITGNRFLTQYVVGMIGGSSADSVEPVVDFRTQLAFASRTDDTNADVWLLTSGLSALEGAILDQTSIWVASPTVNPTGINRVAKFLAEGGVYYDIPVGDFGAAKSLFSDYSTAFENRLEGDFGYNNTDRLVLPDSGLSLSSGLGYLALTEDQSGALEAVGHLLHEEGYVRSLKGSSGGAVPFDDVVENIQTSVVANAGLSPSISPAFLDFGRRSTDLVTGAGKFPYALAYNRTFVGGGWTHDLEISGSLGSNGLIALGRRRPIEATDAIVALYAGYNLLKSCTDASSCGTLERAAYSASIMAWMQKKLSRNVFNLNRGASVTTFAKIADGSYFSHLGGVSALTINGSEASVTLPDGSVMVLDKAADYWASSVPFSISRWTWPQGVSLDFTVDGEGTLVVSNNLNRELRFRSDQPFPHVTDDSGVMIIHDYGGVIKKRALDGTMYTIVTYEKDSDGKLKISTPEATDKVVITYDDMGNVIERKLKGIATPINYYANDWRSETVGVNGARSVSVADPYGRFAESTNDVGNISRSEFDRLGRVVKSMNAVNAAELEDVDGDYIYSEITYDKYHHRTSVTAHSKPYDHDGDGDDEDSTPYERDSLETTYAYHGAVQYRQLYQVTDPQDNVTEMHYFPSTSTTGAGLLKKVITPAVAVDGVTGDQNLETTYSYTAHGLLEKVTTPDGTITEITYGANQLPDMIVKDAKADEDDTTALEIKTNFTAYTPWGGVAEMTDHRGTKTSITYDDFRRRTLVQVTDAANTLESVDMGYVYDDDGRLTATRQCTSGSRCESEGDILFEVSRGFTDAGALAWIKDAQGNETSISYNYGSNYLAITAPNGIQTRKHFDSLGRLTSVVSHYGSEQAITERMNYDAEGLLAWVEDGRDTKTLYSYDHWNRQYKTAYVGGYSVEVTGFDTLGRPETVKTRGGDTVSMSYDALGRVTGRAVTGGATYSYAYDVMSRIAEVTRVTTTTDTISYAYDALGRQTSETGAHGYVMGTTYNDTAGTYTLDYNGDYTVVYNTDAFGRVDDIRELTHDGTLIADYSYDPLSRVEEIAYGDGSKQTFGFDASSGWLESVSLDINGDDDATDTDEVTFTYGRDQFGRITREEISNSDYIYTPTADETIEYLSNPINQYTDVNGFEPTYDDAGNLTNDGTYSYAWDAENLLTEVRDADTDATIATYAYDAAGRRSQKYVAKDGGTTTRYLWGGATNYAEYDVQGSVTTLQRVFVYGPGLDEPVMVREYDALGDAFEKPLYIHRDGKNTVFAVTGKNDQGVTIAANKFAMDVWGNGADATNSPFKFTSRRVDDETDNYYYRNRYYHPMQGRFMSNDPIGYGDGLNMYAYVGNDPVNRYDPMGLASTCIQELDINGLWTLPECEAGDGLSRFVRELEQFQDQLEREAAAMEDWLSDLRDKIGDKAKDAVGKASYLKKCGIYNFEASVGLQAGVKYNYKAANFELKANALAYKAETGSSGTKAGFSQSLKLEAGTGLVDNVSATVELSYERSGTLKGFDYLDALGEMYSKPFSVNSSGDASLTEDYKFKIGAAAIFGFELKLGVDPTCSQ